MLCLQDAALSHSLAGTSLALLLRNLVWCSSSEELHCACSWTGLHTPHALPTSHRPSCWQTGQRRRAKALPLFLTLSVQGGYEWAFNVLLCILSWCQCGLIGGVRRKATRVKGVWQVAVPCKARHLARAVDDHSGYMVENVQVLQRENNRIDPVVLALADLIADQPDRLLPHIHFEGDYCLACDWRRLDLKESAEVMPPISEQASRHLPRFFSN